MGAIQITGLPANDPVPGSYIQVSFAQGAASNGSATYGALLMGTKTTSGSATPDTVIYGPNSSPPLVTENDAIALFGAGSPLHRMFNQFVAVNKATPVHAIAITESAGAASTGTITISGTTASAAGVLRVNVGEGYVERAISVGDTPTATAAAAVALINAQTSWGVTAANTAGVITLTNKVKGPNGNWGRYSATLTAGTGLTVTPSAQTSMTGGTTAQVYTNALATILPYRFFYIVAEDTPAAGASTNLTNIKSQIDTQALPLSGLRQGMFAATTDTLANATTMASTNLNSARAELVWSPDSDRRPEELAAFAAGVYALEEQGISPRCNFSGYGTDANSALIWNLKAPLSGRAPTRSEIVTALNNGITPIGVGLRGDTYLVKRITTRSLNGSLNDYRIRDAHKRTIMDRFADDLQAKLVLNFSGRKIGNDPVQGQRTPGPDVVTPTAIRAAVIQLTRDYEALDLIENVAATIAAMIVQRETVPTTRMGIRVPIDVIDIADQFAAALDQVA